LPEKILNTNSERRIARNAFYGFSTWFLPLILSLIATPIIVKTLGDTDYGIYALVLGFVGYSFTFSVGRAVTKYIAEYRPIGETKKIREVISATLLMSIVVGLVAVGLIYFSAPWIVRDVFRIAEVSQEKTIFAFHLAAWIIFTTILTQLFQAVVQGVHRFDVYARIVNVGNFAMIFGNLLFAFSGFGLLVLLGWNLSISIAMLIGFFVSARNVLPELGIDFRLSGETTKLVLRYSSGVVGYQVLANLLLLFERGWITRKLGSESLTYYVIPMSLGMFIHSFISSLMLVIFPLASELKNDKDKLLRLYLKATKIACLLVFFLVTTLIVESDSFLKLYLGDRFAEKSTWLLIMHTVTFGLLAILTVSWQMTEGLGFPRYNLKVFIACVIVTVTLMILLTANYGNPGVAFARMMGFCTIFVSVFYVEKWFFEKVQRAFWLKLFLTLAAASLVAGISELLIIRNLNLSWISFAVSVGTGAGVYVLSLSLLNFVTTEDRDLVKKILYR